MKLRTKLMALCAALLLLVAMSLTAAMLWQVRAQSMICFWKAVIRRLQS